MHKKLYENVEFSFGKGVGGKIYDAINKAKHSVFILTPYISQGYIDFLLRKKQDGIHVSLVTTTDAQKGMDEIYRKILLQHRVADDKKNGFQEKGQTLVFSSWIGGTDSWFRRFGLAWLSP